MSRGSDRRKGAASAPRGAAPGLRDVVLPASLLLTGVLLLALSSHAQATLYKWTDARGVVHYSDQLPPDAVDRARYELNRQGLPIRKTEAARPVVQRLAKNETEEQRAREAEREKVIAERRDKALLESYTDPAEIDLAKSRAMATIDGQIQSAGAFIAQMQRRRDELESKKATYAPRPVPGEIARELLSIDDEIARQTEFIAGKKKESATVAARYDADKLRFIELRAPTSGSVTTTDGSGARVGLELTSAK
ncbi:MAG: DUF4124 domain-containing protein [Betaproteobacteria bacterium]|jgi:hypothetical protein